MSAVENWRERAQREVEKHPSKYSSDSPEKTRKARWKLRTKISAERLQEKLQHRADEFSMREKVPSVPVSISLKSSTGAGGYRLHLKERGFLGRFRTPQVMEREVRVGTGGSLIENPVILGTLYHELGHHKHASLDVRDYLGLGKNRPKPSSGKGSRKARWNKEVRGERIAWGFADPYLQQKTVQNWDKRIALRTYTSIGEHRKKKTPLELIGHSEHGKRRTSLV